MKPHRTAEDLEQMAVQEARLAAEEAELLAVQEGWLVVGYEMNRGRQLSTSVVTCL